MYLTVPSKQSLSLKRVFSGSSRFRADSAKRFAAMASGYGRWHNGTPSSAVPTWEETGSSLPPHWRVQTSSFSMARWPSHSRWHFSQRKGIAETLSRSSGGTILDSLSDRSARERKTHRPTHEDASDSGL